MAEYHITDVDELQAISPTHLADDCILDNDIDAAATSGWNEGLGFIPIGNGTPFTGTFDGGGFTISDLFVNVTGASPAGLFGSVDTFETGSASYVKNVSLTDVDITGLVSTGGLVGYAAGSSTAPSYDELDFENCSVTGSVAGTNDNVGGLVGYSTGDVTYTDCFSTAAVSTDGSGDDYVGGFAGWVAASIFTSCYATGAVSGDSDVGGFVGYSAGTATYTSCYATGAVTSRATSGNTFVGGFSGFSSDESYTSCYATGNVTHSGTAAVYAGGFIGKSQDLSISKCTATGSITANSSTTVAYIGGFIGNISNNATETIGESYASGAINATTAGLLHAGGFSGTVTGGGALTISDCYSRGNVCASGINDADGWVGGFIGDASATITITECYSTGSVDTTSSKGGGFSGDGASELISECYWDTDTSGWATSNGGTGKSTLLMKVESTYTDWDYDSIWLMESFVGQALAGNKKRVWLSGVDDYENFEEGVKDDDSFSLAISTTNDIRWIKAMEALFVGTSGDEWLIRSNKLDTPLTPTNFDAKQQTNFGNRNIQPVKINEQILFVDFVGRKVRELTYNDTIAKYVAPDLTALAEHITESGIVCMAHQKNPDSILWCVLDDGSLICLTYERDQNVVAWAKHPIAGTVQSVCVTPSADEDRISLSVLRDETITYGGETVTYEDATVTYGIVYIEKMMPRNFGTSLEDAFFVDCGITVANSPASTTIAGLTHLVAKVVTVLGDGVKYTPTTVVDDDGEITISTAVTKAQVGKAFTSKLEPMKPVVSTQMGTSAASIATVKEMGISLLNSAGVKYGASDSALYDIDLDDARWVNLTEIDGLFSGTVAVSVDGGFSLESPLIISSSSPLPCTVRALIPRMDVTGR